MSGFRPSALVQARWALTAAWLALGGCGNAYEHISVGEWQEVGKAEPPVSRSEGQYDVTTLKEGSVINERMRPLRSQLASLDGDQRRANLACEISKKCETASQTEQRRQLRDRLLEEAIRQNKALECELEKKCE